MLGRHQKTSPKETTLVTAAWKESNKFHTHEKMRLKRAMNKRMRKELKSEITQSLLLP